MHWMREDFFVSLLRVGLAEYDEVESIAWHWQSIDGVMINAALARETVGPNPTDRGKKGSKRHLLVDERGVPISIVVTGANRHIKSWKTETIYHTSNNAGKKLKCFLLFWCKHIYFLHQNLSMLFKRDKFIKFILTFIEKEVILAKSISTQLRDTTNVQFHFVDVWFDGAFYNRYRPCHRNS